MPQAEYLCQVIGFSQRDFSTYENTILEADLFCLVCNELIKYFSAKYQTNDLLPHINQKEYKNMIEANFIHCVVNDILSTEAYNLSGIALYTQTPEDVIFDLAIGQYINPSFTLSRKIIELHKTIRPNLYKSILRKIIKIK